MAENVRWAFPSAPGRLFKAIAFVAAWIVGLLASLSAAEEVPLGFRVMGTRIAATAENVSTPAGSKERAPQTNLVLPALSAEESSNGCVVFSKNCLELIYPSTRPLREEITDRLETFSPAGEYESATFAVHALREMKGVRIVTGDLTGPGGSRIAACSIDVRSVRCMPRQDGPGVYVLRPTLLEKPAELEIPKDATQQFWVTIWVPTDAAPGEYRGTIGIQAEGLTARSLQLEMDVLPIHLLRPATLHGMYYWTIDTPASSADYKLMDLGRLRRDIMNMKEHGMNTVLVNIPPVCQASKDGKKVRFDMDPLGPLVALYQEAGFRSVVYNMSLRELRSNPLGDFPTMLSAYVAGFKERGWPEPICSVGDESDANNTRQQVLGQLADIRKRLPGITIFTTIVFPENSELHEPFVDIRAFSSYIDDTVVAKTRQAGRQLWQYSGPVGYGLFPKGERLYRGIWTSKLGLDGVLQWIYWWPSTCYVFPGQDGPLATLGWEAMREGIEDEKYLFTLRTLIEQARKSSSKALAAAADDAEGYLHELYAAVDTSPRKDNNIFPVRQAADKLEVGFYDRMRRGIAGHVLKLTAELAQ